MRLFLVFAASVSAAAIAAGCTDSPEGSSDGKAAVATSRTCATIDDTPVRLPGGTFAMGEDDVYAEEGPVRQTTVGGFWIDPHEVTNRQFGEFVEATGFVTIAEKPVDLSMFDMPADQIPPEMLQPGSAVFTAPDRPSRNYADWWKFVPGANWKMPYGPGGPNAADDEPVVHLGWDDMVAYAEWRGGRLPTEAEWEYAASAGQRSKNMQPAEANSWQGVFPVQNEETDGFKGIAPIGCYQPNANGLYDMVGNVWEVTSDFYRPGHDPASTDNPRGPSESDAYDPLSPAIPSRTVKGGSYLCAPNYCQRYRPASRQGRDPGLGTSNVGFRLVYDSQPKDVK